MKKVNFFKNTKYDAGIFLSGVSFDVHLNLNLVYNIVLNHHGKHSTLEVQGDDLTIYYDSSRCSFEL